MHRPVQQQIAKRVTRQLDPWLAGFIWVPASVSRVMEAQLAFSNKHMKLCMVLRGYIKNRADFIHTDGLAACFRCTI